MVTTISSLEWLQTLADSSRVRLLNMLHAQELSVGELCAILQLPQSTVSRHLKLLLDGQWVVNRRDGTIHLYRVAEEIWVEARRDLWTWVRDQADSTAVAQFDFQRLRQVLATRRSRSEEFFSSAADEWDRLRVDLFGRRLDACVLAASLPGDAVVGELGCGSAPLAQLVAPFVREVVAIDSSSAMLAAAERRVAGLQNVNLKRAELNQLPLEARSLDAAWMVLVLPYLIEPVEVLREAARVLKPLASLILVDLLPHDRQAYRQEMGHLCMGVGREELSRWCSAAGLVLVNYVGLPPDPDAKGPALFAAVVKCR